MPRLLALHGPDRRLVAAVGCRAAAEGALFLEQYLQCPVEATLRARLGAEVPRHRIVEIGNLACRDLRGALAIVQRTIPFLVDEGFTWVVFTAADTLRNVFAHLALEPQPLCRADRDRIARPGEWGTYYEHAPVVVAGRLRDGLRVAARSVADGRDDRSVTTPPGSAVAPRSALPVLGA